MNKIPISGRHIEIDGQEHIIKEVRRLYPGKLGGGKKYIVGVVNVKDNEYCSYLFMYSLSNEFLFKKKIAQN